MVSLWRRYRNLGGEKLRKLVPLSTLKHGSVNRPEIIRTNNNIGVSTPVTKCRTRIFQIKNHDLQEG